jgi:hypothetical protein
MCLQFVAFALKNTVWHGFKLLAKMLSAKRIDKALVLAIFEALENNEDLPATWQIAKHSTFQKVFGKADDDGKR